MGKRKVKEEIAEEAMVGTTEEVVETNESSEEDMNKYLMDDEDYNSLVSEEIEESVDQTTEEEITENIIEASTEETTSTVVPEIDPDISIIDTEETVIEEPVIEEPIQEEETITEKPEKGEEELVESKEEVIEASQNEEDIVVKNDVTKVLRMNFRPTEETTIMLSDSMKITPFTKIRVVFKRDNITLTEQDHRVIAQKIIKYIKSLNKAYDIKLVEPAKNNEDWNSISLQIPTIMKINIVLNGIRHFMNKFVKDPEYFEGDVYFRMYTSNMMYVEHDPGMNNDYISGFMIIGSKMDKEDAYRPKILNVSYNSDLLKDDTVSGKTVSNLNKVSLNSVKIKSFSFQERQNSDNKPKGIWFNYGTKLFVTEFRMTELVNKEDEYKPVIIKNSVSVDLLRHKDSATGIIFPASNVIKIYEAPNKPVKMDAKDVNMFNIFAKSFYKQLEDEMEDDFMLMNDFKIVDKSLFELLS